MGRRRGTINRLFRENFPVARPLVVDPVERENRCTQVQALLDRFDRADTMTDLVENWFLVEPTLFAVDVSGAMGGPDQALGYLVINRFFKDGVDGTDVVRFDTEVEGEPALLRRARRSVEVARCGGISFAPVTRFLDERREYDIAISFTDGHAMVSRRPMNRRTRVRWRFKSEERDRRQHKALRAIARTAFQKEASDEGRSVLNRSEELRHDLV